MPNTAKITSYQVYVSASSEGFNEWRRNIFLHTEEDGVYVSLRFVDGDATGRNHEQVRENGTSLVYLPMDNFDTILHLLQTEKPVFVSLYESANWALIQTGQEPPGDEESGT